MACILVNYKSGRQVEFDVEKFEIQIGPTSSDHTAKWTTTEKSKLKPIILNVAEIESVWEKR